MPSQRRCGTEAFWITATQNERLLRDPATGCAIGRSSMWEEAALSQSHSSGMEGWWDLSFNVRRQRQRPGQAWLRAGCRHLSPPTLSESSYTYLLRSTALRVLTRQSPNTPCRGRVGRETSLEGRRALGRALTSPTPLFLLRFLQAHPEPMVASPAAVQQVSQASWNQGRGSHRHRDTVFTRATSGERFV